MGDSAGAASAIHTKRVQAAVAICLASNARTRSEPTDPPTKNGVALLILIATGAALRVDEAYSLRWCDCEWYLLDDSDETEAGKLGLETVAANLLKLMVLGKHSRGAEREEARGNSLAFFGIRPP
jgi:hypothetical protein